MCIVPRNVCTKFHLKHVEQFLSYEVRFKLYDDADDTHDDDAKGITIARRIFFENRHLKMLSDVKH